MARNTEPDPPDPPPELSATEARQASWGKPVLYVLLGATAAAVLAIVIVFLFADTSPWS